MQTQHGEFRRWDRKRCQVVHFHGSVFLVVLFGFLPSGCNANVVTVLNLGGMQDYNYIFHGVMEITLEVSCCKHPMASTLQQHWLDNRKVRSRQ